VLIINYKSEKEKITISDSTNISENDIESFNNKFSAFLGKNKSDFDAKYLVDVVNNINSDSTSNIVSITTGVGGNFRLVGYDIKESEDLASLRTAITNNDTIYDIEVLEKNEKGKITKILIKGKNKPKETKTVSGDILNSGENN